MAIGPNGEVYIVILSFPDDRHEPSDALKFFKSTDYGFSFSEARTIQDIEGVGRGFGRIGLPEYNSIAVQSFPDMKVDRSGGCYNGNIYITFADVSYGDADIYLIKSTDGGEHWSTKIKVNDDPIANGKQQYFPSIDIDQTNGDIFISYFNMDNTATSGEEQYRTNHYIAHSTDGGNTFHCYKVSDKSFIPTSISTSDNGYMGDYYEVAANNGVVYATWSDNTDGTGIFQAYYSQFGVEGINTMPDGSKGGNFSKWDGVNFIEYPTPVYFTIPTNQISAFMAEDTVVNHAKFIQWVTTPVHSKYINFNEFEVNSPTSKIISSLEKTYSDITIQNLLEMTNYDASNDLISFKDPWLRDDYSDPKGTQNRGLNAIWHSYSSPYQITTGGEHQGVFLGQNPQFNPDLPIYSVKVESPQTISINNRAHKFYFQHWAASPSGSATFQNANLAETPVVFNDAGATVKAVMKGTQLSDNQSAFTNNNQRKMIRTANGNLFLTYESMGGIWVEMSTDNGRTWDLANSAPFSTSYSNHSPSLAIYRDGNDCELGFYLVYAWDDTDILHGLTVVKFNRFGEYVSEYTFDDYWVQGELSDMRPVINVGEDGYIFIIYEVKTSDQNYEPGLYYYFIDDSHGNFVKVDNNKINGTSSASKKPAIASPYTNQKSYREVYLTWEESNSIKYERLEYLYDGQSFSLIEHGIETPSYGSGYMQNTDPSIAYSNGTVLLAWHGYKKVFGGIRGGSKAATIYHNIVLRKKRAHNWGQFLIYGDNAFKPSISSTYDGRDYYFVWSEYPAQSRYVLGSDNHLTKFLSTSTRYVQAYNLNDVRNIQAMSFNEASAPYEFLTSVDSPPSKDEENAYYVGREGVVRKDSAEFYFAVGDVLLNGKTVEFKSLTDTLAIDGLTMLNEYLETEPIELNSESDFQYSVVFGVTNDTTASIVLDEDDYVNFTVTLVNAATGEVVGSYDNVTFTKAEAGQYKNIAYKINTEGMQSGTFKLRVRISDILSDASYSLGKIYSTKTLLNKTDVKELPLEGTMKVTKYELLQNYPNPFNPTTKIGFKVKAPRGKTVRVKLTVYNALGQKVAELVNKEMEAGSYEATFNAKGLASGVYYYRIQSGNFTETKKMILLK